MNTVRTIGLRARASVASLSIVVLSLAACSDQPAAPRSTLSSSAASLDRDGRDGRGADDQGAVYALTNATSRNGVIAFHRAADGSLTPLGTFATGGRGTGGAVDPLASQYSVVLSDDHDALFAVDAGSNEISSFRIRDGGALSLAGTVSSGGMKPISLAVHDNLLYVLNTGDNSVSGFRITGAAGLVALPHTTHSLAAGANGAAAVRFTPDGNWLVVTERVSNRLEVFAVLPNGRLGDPIVSAAHGGASFGFDITARNQPIVSETQGSVSSYGLTRTGTLTPITASIPTSGNATCWVTITSDGRFAYATNAGSNSVAGFGVDAAGHLTALTPGSATGSAGAGATPIDLDHVGSRFLYTLETGRGMIGTFTIGANGSLSGRPDTPAGAPSSGLQGIAAY